VKRYCILVITRNGLEFFVGPRALSSKPYRENSWETREMAEFKLAALQRAYQPDLESERYRMDVYEFIDTDTPTH
jgi:hypothetical protein